MSSVETVALLERSVGYALGGLGGVTPAALGRATPCHGWDVGALLRHTADSLDALLEAVDTGSVRLRPGPGPASRGAPPDDPAAALVAAFRSGAVRLLGAWTSADDRPVTVGGCPLQASMVAMTGAIEIAVHGWDIACATGNPRPIPPGLAGLLLDPAMALVTDATRAGLFAPAVAVPGTAAPSDRLLAHLGRDPLAFQARGA
ncbi:maleylpyruvate isomerase family mycothiol-dependent enzyme [Actinomadura nitritigenes]|uniref:TIGR03086 family protein n=1 Tax=Actinomadura nitritigenes TaxID=134602 RepID=A0ABS3RAJ3_9ACTN|nr:TIGR03086 family metal-binding protein [Actinomadura nitritigenes]MBO2442599.1 TIGR03086 family protein [Actinomadura nitritigenes]